MYMSKYDHLNEEKICHDLLNFTYNMSYMCVRAKDCKKSKKSD